VSFSKLQKSFEVTFVFNPETILNALIREAENPKIFDRWSMTDNQVSYAEKDFKSLIHLKEEMDNSTPPVKFFSCYVG
jgi:hypothetical protein